MTITSNVPPPPRLTGQADTDLAAITAWAYSLYRVLTTDDGGLSTLTNTVTLIGTGLDNLHTSTATDIAALAAAQDTLADAIDALTLRLNAIAAITPLPAVPTTAEIKAAVDAIIAAAA